MTETPPTLTLAEAEARSRHARERLLGTLSQVQDKLSPRTLAQDVVDNGIATVRTRPRSAIIAGAVAILFIVRKPLARLIWRGAKHATGAATASLKHRRAPRETKGYSQ
jgi:hypothetical protein